MTTLLAGVNALLNKVESLDSDGSLTSLSDSARQSWIDNAIAAINETVDRLYALPDTPERPSQMSSSMITLATGTQAYALASDAVRLIPEYGLIDQTNNRIISIDAGQDAYRKLIVADLEQNDTGLPSIAAIRPTDGMLWLDRAPTADYNGNIYYYRYEKDTALSAAADIFPFSDPVYRAVILAATELYQKINHREFSGAFFNSALSQAAERLSMLPRRRSWDNDVVVNITDPFVA